MLKLKKKGDISYLLVVRLLYFLEEASRGILTGPTYGVVKTDLIVEILNCN